MDEIVQDLKDKVEELVRGGFVPVAEIAEQAADYVADEYEGDDLLDRAEELMVGALAAHAKEQLTWEGPTDCDRLDLAFAALRQAGVMARQDFTCCQSCGHAEIGDELREGDRGYTFYHQQDTERAVEGGGVMLAYGAVVPGEDACVAIGNEIVAALAEAGLQPDWDGSSNRRIHVPLDWRKRR